MGTPEDEGAEVTEGLKRWNPEEMLKSLLQESNVLGEEPEQTAKRLFRENLPIAATSIVHLATQSPNEKTRLTAAQYVVDRAFGRIGTSGDSEKKDLDKLLEDFLADCIVESNPGNESRDQRPGR